MWVCNCLQVQPKEFLNSRKTTFCEPKADSNTTFDRKVIYGVTCTGSATFSSVLMIKLMLCWVGIQGQEVGMLGAISQILESLWGDVFKYWQVRFKRSRVLNWWLLQWVSNTHCLWKAGVSLCTAQSVSSLHTPLLCSFHLLLVHCLSEEPSCSWKHHKQVCLLCLLPQLCEVKTKLTHLWEAHTLWYCAD